MLLKFFIIIFILFPTYSFATECSKNITPNIIINQLPFSLTYNYNMTLLDLTHYAIEKNNENINKNKELSYNNIVIRGLTSSQFYYKISANFKYDKQYDSSYCVYPDNIIIDVGFKPFVVFIEKEYKEKSCQHDAILEHENKHVKIMSVVSNYYIPFFKKKILKSYYRFYDKSFININNEQELLKPLSVILQPYLNKIQDQVTELNSKLDSPESLNYTKKECNIWYMPSKNMKEAL